MSDQEVVIVVVFGENAHRRAEKLDAKFEELCANSVPVDANLLEQFGNPPSDALSFPQHRRMGFTLIEEAMLRGPGAVRELLYTPRLLETVQEPVKRKPHQPQTPPPQKQPKSFRPRPRGRRKSDKKR